MDSSRCREAIFTETIGPKKPGRSGAAHAALDAAWTVSGNLKTMMKPEFADVVAVKEVFETVVTPRETCEDIQVQHRAPVKDEHRVAGTVVGGLAVQ